MNFGYVKVATYTPKIKVADVNFNVEQIIDGINLADKEGAQVLAFPELCITGYTCGDLFYEDTLILGAKNGLVKIAEATKNKRMLVFVGLPVKHEGLIYNVCAGISNGSILGLVPKTYLPNYNEFYEKRYFAPAKEIPFNVRIANQNVLMYKNVFFCDEEQQSFKVSAEICEDLWTVVPPSLFHSVNGARIIVNLSASDESAGKVENRKRLVVSHSEKAVCAYVYANAGEGESTTDAVFSGHSLIVEKGEILNESAPFNNGLNIAEVDLDYIDYERSKTFNYDFGLKEQKYIYLGFNAGRKEQSQRIYDKTPFIKNGEEQLILTMQAEGLKKRIEHSNAKKLVIGLSGGLDSTLAILVCKLALERCARDSKDILAVTMPCFGTTERTLDNSIKLARALKTSIKKVDITKSVTRHLKDIEHDGVTPDAAYENAQARERTQVLMDIANMENGLVVGTGDMSELALGWATYNGDHMSMYGVNASVTKTLVRHLVEYIKNNSKTKLKNVLEDILDTPVSPELIPSKTSEITQKTEDIVGPYILHDFFMYNILKRGFTPQKLYRVALNTFKGEFSEQTILKWLKNFYRRFFSQQFKRSCLPDGVKVGEISLSPRGGFKMPSDAVSSLWLDELNKL